MAARSFEKKFMALCETLARYNLTGAVPPPPPWNDGTPRYDVVNHWVGRGGPALPWMYKKAYVDPLSENLGALIQRGVRAAERHQKNSYLTLEMLTSAVYEHAPGYDWTPHLHRFLAVVSDLYRSFLRRREDTVDGCGGADGKIPVAEALPPLASFTYAPGAPVTYPIDRLDRQIGRAPVSVVSMPAFYAKHPILWAWLAHETGGHDVVHAVRKGRRTLLHELQDGLPTALRRSPVRGLTHAQLVELWSYWMNEASADVYGVLNIGPTFGVGLAVLLAVWRHKTLNFALPRLVMVQRVPPNKYPPDILRIHLVLGAVEALSHLTLGKRRYIRDLRTLASICAGGSKTVGIVGPLHEGRRIIATAPLRDMQRSAQLVGRYIVSARFSLLGMRSIREVETWDDCDERAARRVRDALAHKRSINDLGDDAQLLAGAIMHALERPKQYVGINTALAGALDKSFETDPVWCEIAAKA